MKVAVLGLGTAGFTLHLPALAGLPDAQVVGGCDLDAAFRARAAARWKIPVFDELDRMLEATTPDVVIVATPPDVHADSCVRAFQANAHVICEKPFAPTLADADRMIAAASQHNRQLAFNHDFREMPIFSALRSEVSRIGAGQVTFVQVWQMMNLAPWAEVGWRGALRQRALFEAGIHLLDLVVAVYGETPMSVQASTSSGGLREERTDAVVTATLEFSRGRLAQIVQNRLCLGENHYIEVRADTTEGSLRASFGGRARLSLGLLHSKRPHARVEYGNSGLAWRERGDRRTILARNGKDPGMVATRKLTGETLAAFANGTRPPVSSADARALLDVTLACYHAADTGQRVYLDERRQGPAGGTPK